MGVRFTSKSIGGPSLAIVAAVGGGQRVLELRVGDAGAGLATELQAKHGCTVVTRGSPSEWRGQGRIESRERQPRPAGIRPRATHSEFTVVIADDVLPRLIDPLAALRAAERELAPMGRLIVTVPNIGHTDVSHALAEGHFRYADRGLLDRRYLRWFTLSR